VSPSHKHLQELFGVKELGVCNRVVKDHKLMGGFVFAHCFGAAQASLKHIVELLHPLLVELGGAVARTASVEVFPDRV